MVPKQATQFVWCCTGGRKASVLLVEEKGTGLDSIKEVRDLGLCIVSILLGDLRTWPYIRWESPLDVFHSSLKECMIVWVKEKKENQGLGIESYGVSWQGDIWRKLEMSSLKTKEGHTRVPGDANRRKENGNFPNRVPAFFSLALLLGPGSPVCRRVPKGISA